MDHFLLNLSLTGVVLLLFAVMLTGALIEWLVRRYIWRVHFRGGGDVANYIAMLTVFFGLLLGLMAVDLWQKQDAAQANTINEASQIRILYSLSNFLPGDRRPFVNALGDYTQSVIMKEWPSMLRDHSTVLFIASPELDMVRNTLFQLEPQNSAQSAIFQQALTCYASIVAERHQRLIDAEDAVPGLLWLTLAVGAGFIWVTTWFIAFDSTATQFTMSSITVGYMFLLIYLIVILEHPFLGVWRVDATPYQHVLQILH